MHKKILIPLPSTDFDPTEAAIPWKILSENNIQIVFSTPNGLPSQCDPRMISGKGLSILAPMLCADENARNTYVEMSASPEFLNPIKWTDISVGKFDGILLPGGHAPGMKEYLESSILQRIVVDFFGAKKIVAAICHGVILAARSRTADKKSILFDRKTTALLASQEISAWLLTGLWLGNYYRTYPTTVETEVRSVLADSKNFIRGPVPIKRDSPNHLGSGFCLKDQNYISARWPGDAHIFAHEILKELNLR